MSRFGRERSVDEVAARLRQRLDHIGDHMARFRPPVPSDSVVVLPTPGRWRQTKASWGGSRLPSRAGSLLVVRGYDGVWHVLFKTKTVISQAAATIAYLDEATGRVVVESSHGTDEYAPADQVKRADPLPVPPRPELTHFRALDYERGCHVIHTVAEVRAWPDPNREWNASDASVTAVCGHKGWVQPRNMQPSFPPAATPCGGCLGDSG